MAAKTRNKKKIILNTVIFGCVSAALYAAVFSFSNPIAELFARGGAYAALPIATVFVFSFAHGAFASNLWSAMGIEAGVTQTAKRTAVSAPRPTQRPRPSLRMSA